MKQTLTILLLTIGMINTAISSNKFVNNGYETGIYLQEIKNDIQLPGGSDVNVVELIGLEEAVVAVSPGAIYLYAEGKWQQKTVEGTWQAACADQKGSYLLASARKVVHPISGEEHLFPARAGIKEVHCLYTENEKIYAGTDNGCWILNNSWNVLEGTQGIAVKQITGGKDDDLWMATSDGIFRRRNGEWLNLNNYVMAPGVGRDFYSISNGKVQEDVIFGGAYTLSQIAENGDHWTVTREDGLPYGPVTTVNCSEDVLWLGTPNGAIKKDNKWHYYHGKRWLPDNKINDILPIDQNTVWIATPKGISEIKKVEMTMEQKAERFNQRLNQRHIHHGFSADCRFDSPGDTASWKCYTSDNDGLWTAIYLAAESFRYAVTGEQDAYDNAVRTYEAMERLETINPIPGFPSRSYVTIDEHIDKGEWHETPDGKWKWKADTSSDEIVGHMFAYPIFYELVAQGEMKERVKDLVDRIMTHIVDNNFLLIDLDGNPTRWGVWAPDSLNMRPRWWYERGINSLQILAFLDVAYFVTGDEKYEKAYRYLINEHGYAQNMVQQKMYFPYEINHSDDELSFLPYYTLLRYVRDDELKKVYRKSMARSWGIEQHDQSPLWNIIASSALDKDCDLQVAIEVLKEYPMDIIKWGVQNSHRWDLRKNPMSDRFGREQSVTAIPVDERSITKWNANPFQMDRAGNGTGEDDGAAWLLPYWMGRYHGFIIEKE